MYWRRLVVFVTIVSLVFILRLLLVSKLTPDDVYSHMETLRSKTVGDLAETIDGLKRSAGGITTLVCRNINGKEELEVVVDTSKVFQASSLPLRKNQKYKDGKEIIHEELYKCRPPQYLPGYRSPCWLSTSGTQQVCMARVVLLGYHKCGTSDVAKWFYNTKFSSTTVDYFKDGVGSTCPVEWMEKARIHIHGILKKTANTTVYGGCPGCSLINQVIRKDAHSITIHSAIQYVKHLQTDDTRYIITMRNPTQRVLSHYFYQLKTNATIPDHSLWKDRTTPEEIGNEFLHDLVATAIDLIESCLQTNGINECIVTDRHSAFGHDLLALMISESCYAPFIRQVLKFIPMELIYFSKMEDYAAYPDKVVPEIFKFVGEDLTGMDLGLSKSVINTGTKKKPVHQKTIALLDEFFRPFNDDLADILGDEKWRYSRNNQ